MDLASPTQALRPLSVLVVCFLLLIGCVHAPQSGDKSTQNECGGEIDPYLANSIAREGWRFSDDEAEALRDNPGEGAEGARNRLRLAAYANRKGDFSDEALRKAAEDYKWIVTVCPSSAVAGATRHFNLGACNEDVTDEIEKVWQRAVDEYQDDPRVLYNAAMYYRTGDKNRSADLLTKASALAPSSLPVLDAIGRLRYAEIGDPDFAPQDVGRVRRAEKAIHRYLEEFAGQTTDTAEVDLVQFYYLGKRTFLAYAGGNAVEASSLALQLIRRAADYRSDWNYGNALHEAHTILGKIALREGDIRAAKEHLLASVEHQGSPQLNSFGPSMALAKLLADRGESRVVIDYVRRALKFWSDSSDESTGWLNALSSGRIPDFGRHLRL